MPEPMTPEEWRRWLSQPDCRAALETAARLVYRQARKLALPARLLPCDNPWGVDESQLQDCFDALTNDLWVFLASRPESWLGRPALQRAAAMGSRSLLLRIAQDYLHHLQDRARTFGQDPWRALYRRLRQVLRAETAVHYRATERAAFYSFAPEAPELPPAGMRPEGSGYGDWDSPLQVAAAKDLLQRPTLVRLARLFWEQARTRLGWSYFLPVRELVGFLVAHYGAVLTGAVELNAADLADDEGPGPEDRWAAPAEEAEVAVTRARLAELARQAAAGLSGKQKEALVLIYDQEMTLAQAAERLGYRGPGGAHYLCQSAVQRLQDFCLLWPGLSPPDCNERLSEAFLLEVFRSCKGESQGRD